MRPDYTLSIWPNAFTEQQAEEQELIVHVHFDAKYKVEGLKYFTETIGNIDLDEEKSRQKEGSYKRVDLLKMHAYKDAIRRTVGAYVLYPDESSVLIAYVKGNKHQAWIENHKYCNIRMDDKGLKKYGIEEASVKYILFRGKDEKSNAKNVWRVTGEAPQIVNKQDLLSNYQYPSHPSNDFYLLYKIEKINTDDFGDSQWNLTKLLDNRVGAGQDRFRPFAVSITNLSKYLVNKKNKTNLEIIKEITNENTRSILHQRTMGRTRQQKVNRCHQPVR